jgi:N-acylglucosamine-6-phosphate 2-epimerase
MNKLLAKIRGGLIVSCYAGHDLNEEMSDPYVMACMANSCVNGGAVAIRTNLENVAAIRKAVDVPLIGIKKVYKSGGIEDSNFRITPTLKEVEELVNAGADIVAVDATKRERYDQFTLKEFIKKIREKWDIGIVGDISTVEEGVAAFEAGVDAVGTTLSGYTPYSKNPIVFGTLPLPDPDYQIITELKQAGVPFIIAEGRIDSGTKMKKALDSGASAVVIGTSITEPKKIVKTILMNAK